MTTPALSSFILTAAVVGFLVASNGRAILRQPEVPAAGASVLRWDPDRFQVQRVAAGTRTIEVRAYENVVYVARPVDATHQVMNIYVPDEYFTGRRVGTFTAETAPIFLPNQVGGYMPATPGTPAARGPGGDSQVGAIALALANGYVVASPGARGRTTQDAAGHYTGKAPAAIVDLKAAVRYLRHNDTLMPGNAERIISNGTSAGGALSALLGASGNSADYEPYLRALGAAEARDDVHAVSAYCPITDLDHADMAYEWLFNGVNDYTRMEITRSAAGMQRRQVTGTLTAEQIRLSKELKAGFPAYVNSLDLRGPRGEVLTLDPSGNGGFKDYVKSLVAASAQTALAAGQDLSSLPWLTVDGLAVRELDFDQYVRYAGRMKTTPAFDGLDLGTPENQLFGTGTVDRQHFTSFARERSATTRATRADAHVVSMMNPLTYVGAASARTARHWRIRHGTRDRDTSLAVPVILATRLRNAGYDVDLTLPWDRGHGGDYDLEELFAWIARVAAE